ncbi:hypothetical protein E2C01_081167 [Portunus trituberculatus]|uniref:Uncharacterized protein n=1 Tax=Portunus trituberculatus TaxID=210409 RepID=A0A5B7J1I6_PORTR|nr:hypothetical protein [Portunus trituberculatus]
MAKSSDLSPLIHLFRSRRAKVSLARTHEGTWLIFSKEQVLASSPWSGGLDWSCAGVRSGSLHRNYKPVHEDQDQA